MDKMTEALSKLLPEDQVKEVATVIEEVINDSKAELEKEYNEQLEKAYEGLTSELKTAEETGEQGYHEAFGVIQDLRNRLETQRAEFETALEEGYEEAYQMLITERGKNENISSDLYEEYDKKLGEMKEFLVDKIDEFLQQKGSELYEQARRDVLNDPRLVEHKVTLQKIIEEVSDYITDEDYALATNAKLEASDKKIDELKGQYRLLEARNIRMSTENTKLNEQVRKDRELIQEHTSSDEYTQKKERAKKAKKVEGRGKQVTENTEVIGEHQENTVTNEDGDNTISESMTPEAIHKMKVLSGLIRDDD